MKIYLFVHKPSCLDFGLQRSKWAFSAVKGFAVVLNQARHLCLSWSDIINIFLPIGSSNIAIRSDQDILKFSVMGQS